MCRPVSLAEAHQNLDCEGASKIYGCLALKKADEKEGGQSGVNMTIFHYSAPNFLSRAVDAQLQDQGYVVDRPSLC